MASAMKPPVNHGNMAPGVLREGGGITPRGPG